MTYTVHMNREEWAAINQYKIFQDNLLYEQVAPLPPFDLMHSVSGVPNKKAFAKHGVDIFNAIADAYPDGNLLDSKRILDFGCGCGRLMRMFYGFKNEMIGCDINPEHIDWINDNFDFAKAYLTNRKPPLPFQDEYIETIISISVFSHLSEKYQYMFLDELQRIARQGGYLLLSIHGKRCLERAISEERIFKMLNVDEVGLSQAAKAFRSGEYGFILQKGHLARNDYEYGITFIPEEYIKNNWGRSFDIVDIKHGAIHDFQDIVVCRKK